MKWLEQAVVDVAEQRHHERDQLADHPFHLLADLRAGDTGSHQGLVDVQVHEPHLGVGDLPDRLRVHAGQLQEGHRGQPDVEHGGDVTQHLHVLVVHRLDPPATRSRGRPGCVRSWRAGARCCARPGAACSGPRCRRSRFSIGPIASWPASLACLICSSEWPRAAQAGDDPHVGRGGQRPVSVVARHEPPLDPASDGPGGDPGSRRDLLERQLAGAVQGIVSAQRSVWSRSGRPPSPISPPV